MNQKQVGKHTMHGMCSGMQARSHTFPIQAWETYIWNENY